MGNIAAVEVVAEDRASAEIKKLATDLASAFRSIQSANQPLASSVAEVSKAHEGLIGKMREFRGEQVQQGRMARFYASELLSIVPAGKEAKDTITSLLGMGVEAAAGGLGIGLAIEAVRFGVEQFHRLGEAERKAKEELDKWFASAATAISKAGDEIDELRMKFLGLGDAEKNRAAATLLQDEIDLNNEAIAAIEKKNKLLSDAAGRERMSAQRKANEEQIASFRAQNDTLAVMRDRQIEIAKQKIQNTDKDKKEKEDEEAKKKREKDDEETTRKAYETVKRIGQDREAHARMVAGIESKWTKQGLDEMDRMRTEAAEDLAKLEADDVVGRLAVEEGLARALEELRMKARAEIDREDEQAREKNKAKAREQAQPWIQFSRSISDSFARGFTNSLFHAKSFEDGMRSVFDGLLSAFEQLIDQMVAKLLLSKVLGFLGGLVGGPVGAEIGNAAGGAVGGAVGGRGITGGAGTGMVPSSLTVHITAMDGASVRRVVESRDFQLAMRGVARNT